ncbi:DotU family type IV/VI secretion system protein [Yersinia mollaretii]|uniref:DotU family type IV/VI secretion system protein n=1 Tax=Yersinia mollaretii TaxID=33060 RepID=UPI0011A5EE2A|nr:DotU family type IV/VI secretion system protein [Yersinia mollaretii]MDN0111381.1 DotU family type IV/VI secretion system protein [Yersinia mollaretii]
MMRLVECYLPIWRFATEFYLYPQQYSDYESFRQQSMSLFEQAALAAEQYNDIDDCDNALFAVVVWFDERVLCSSLPWVKQWRSALLQGQLFQTAIGGEVFFNRLDSIDKDNYPLRLVYLFCLLMGFNGKYTQPDNILLAERVTQERQNLPVEWQVWPNQALLTPIDSGNKIVESSYLRRFFENKWAAALGVVALYAVMFIAGMVFLT